MYRLYAPIWHFSHQRMKFQRHLQGSDFWTNFVTFWQNILGNVFLILLWIWLVLLSFSKKIVKFSYQEIEIKTLTSSNVGKHQENFFLNLNYIFDSYYHGLLVLPSESGARTSRSAANWKVTTIQNFSYWKIQEFVGMKIWRSWDSFWFPSKQ